MRLVAALVVALGAVTLAACGGSNDDTATPVPVAERFVSTGDAPGSKPDPLERRETTTDFAIFVPALSERSIDADRDELMATFEDFQSAGLDTRFFGATHDQETSPHLFSSFVELESEKGAAGALEWMEADQLKPCPMSCAVQRTSVVADVPDSRGVHRIATAEEIQRVGTPDQHPEEGYWIGFTVGPVVYTVELHGPPGSVSEDRLEEIVTAYYDRLTAAT
jgi:hypothetical protein